MLLDNVVAEVEGRHCPRTDTDSGDSYHSRILSADEGGGDHLLGMLKVNAAAGKDIPGPPQRISEQQFTK